MNKNEIFTLWIAPDNQKELPLLAHLSLKSMVLCGHDVILYTYEYLENVPDGVKVLDGNEILDSSRIFMYKEGHKTYGGFADLFRLHRLYKYGGTWLDLDVLLIRNINEKYDGDILICSEPTFRFYMHPNNGFLRFPKNDPFIKYMLDYAEKAGNDISHGQTGPRLITNTLKRFPDYNSYLKTFNTYHLLGWKYLNDYSKEPQKLLNKINMDEVIGFHINNTFFDELLTTENPDGLFEILKKSVLNSNSYEEYCKHLKENKILGFESYDAIRDWDLKYLDMADDNLDNSYEYTILIDSKNLKKIEIYNILHSIGFGSQPHDLLKTIQVIIFGKTDIGNDKIRFKDNISLLASDFESIYPYIDEYIYGNYVMLLNKPVIFCPKFFKDKKMEANIESHIIGDDLFVNIFNKKDYNSLLYKYGAQNIFNLTSEMLKSDIVSGKLIYSYETKSDDVFRLIQLINDLNKFDNEDIALKYLNIKSELKKMKFNNLLDTVSYHYYSSYENILNSSSFYEFKLKEENTRLNCLIRFYLNKLNKKYNF